MNKLLSLILLGLSVMTMADKPHVSDLPAGQQEAYLSSDPKEKNSCSELFLKKEEPAEVCANLFESSSDDPTLITKNRFSELCETKYLPQKKREVMAKNNTQCQQDMLSLQKSYMKLHFYKNMMLFKKDKSMPAFVEHCVSVYNVVNNQLLPSNDMVFLANVNKTIKDNSKLNDSYNSYMNLKCTSDLDPYADSSSFTSRKGTGAAHSSKKASSKIDWVGALLLTTMGVVAYKGVKAFKKWRNRGKIKNLTKTETTDVDEEIVVEDGDASSGSGDAGSDVVSAEEQLAELNDGEDFVDEPRPVEEETISAVTVPTGPTSSEDQAAGTTATRGDVGSSGSSSQSVVVATPDTSSAAGNTGALSTDPNVTLFSTSSSASSTQEVTPVDSAGGSRASRALSSQDPSE